MRKFFILLILFCSGFFGSTEEIGNPAWGFTFTVPQGWLYQQMEDGVRHQVISQEDGKRGLPLDYPDVEGFCSVWEE